MLIDNLQIRTLVREGLTPEEAARSLGMDAEATRLALAGSRQPKSIAQMLEEFKPRAIRSLMDIAENGENESARVRALEILLKGEGVVPESTNSELARRLENIKRLEDRPQLIELEEAV